MTATRPAVVSPEALMVASTPNAQRASPSPACRAVATAGAVVGVMGILLGSNSKKHTVSRTDATVLHDHRAVKIDGTTCIIIFVVSRPYQLKQRADRQHETRQRIIEATIELHQTIGPAATTITEIAERAGVGRVTVYRHFPEELSLDRACSGLYFERNPAPDPGSWKTVAESGRAAASGAEGDVRLPRTHRADDRARARGRPRSPRDGAVPRTLGRGRLACCSSPGRRAGGAAGS